MTRCNYKVGIFFFCYRSGGSGCLPSWVLGSVVLKLLVMITFAFIAAHCLSELQIALEILSFIRQAEVLTKF